MSEQNKALAHRFHLEMLQEKKFDLIDKLISPDFVAHVPGLPPEFSKGPEGVKKWFAALHAGISNFRNTHYETIAEGDLVLIRWEGSGIHTGNVFGVPASGRAIKITGLDLFRIAGGQIVEVWQEADYLGLMQQMGAIPGR
jgi:predicted SnoaL-like aldol condensation-catalyzing enzyme